MNSSSYSFDIFCIGLVSSMGFGSGLIKSSNVLLLANCLDFSDICGILDLASSCISVTIFSFFFIKLLMPSKYSVSCVEYNRSLSELLATS